MKQKYFLFGIILALGLSFVGLYSFKKLSSESNQNKTDSTSTDPRQSASPQAQLTTTLNTSTEKGPLPATAPSSFKESFEQIAQSIGTTVADPEKADQAITNLATKIDKAQLKELYVQITSPKSSGDEKLLATELLIRSSLAESVNYLKQIANQSATEHASNSPSTQQEFQAIQMLAVEGLAQKPQFKAEAKTALNELSQSTDDPLLLDRIHRTRLTLDGKVDAPEVQDQKALEQVLRNHHTR